MQGQLADMEEMLNVLQEKDDQVYRTIFEAEPIPETVREAGSGGVLKYRNLIESDLTNKDLVVGNLNKINKIKKGNVYPDQVL